MSGKLCTGAVNNNALHIRSSKAFCEGVAFRAQGTAVLFPLTDNPHAADSEANLAWQAGWNVTDDAATGTVDPADAPCCSVPTNTILA